MLQIQLLHFAHKQYYKQIQFDSVCIVHNKKNFAFASRNEETLENCKKGLLINMEKLFG